METERKKALAWLAFIAIIGIGLVLFLLWAFILNRGTVMIYGETPFTMMEVGGEGTQCEQSPCEMSMRGGKREMAFTKEGYEVLFETVNVKMWRTVEVNLEFQIDPYIEETDVYPEIEAINYTLKYDDNAKSYKLVREGNDDAIVYFQKKIVSPKIIGNDKAVMITAQQEDHFTGYKVKIITADRVKIEDEGVGRTKDGKWSFDGEYFVFSTTDNENLYLLGPDDVIVEMNIASDISQVAWTAGDKLAFFSTEEERDREYYFGMYEPETGEYKEILNFTQSEDFPKNLVSLANGYELYFQAGDKNYKIVLR